MKTLIAVLCEKQKEIDGLLQCIEAVKKLAPEELDQHVDQLLRRIMKLQKQVELLQVVLPMFKEEIHSVQ